VSKPLVSVECPGVCRFDDYGTYRNVWIRKYEYICWVIIYALWCVAVTHAESHVVYVYTRTYIYIYMCMCVHIYIYICVCVVYVYTRIYIYIYTCVCVCKFKCWFVIYALWCVAVTHVVYIYVVNIVSLSGYIYIHTERNMVYIYFIYRKRDALHTLQIHILCTYRDSFFLAFWELAVTTVVSRVVYLYTCMYIHTYVYVCI